MKDLLLTNATGARLYEQYAAALPIIDFHCHLQPNEIHEDKVFEDLGEIWLAYDHYKWRAMRTFGIDEKYITGNASFKEKFMKFAEVLPMLAGNPVHVWCQLELARYFGIREPLNARTAEMIYEKTKARIEAEQLSPCKFIDHSNVEYIATTDDPIDDLHFHKAVADEGKLKTKVVPAFRPDRAMTVASGYAEYIAELSKVSGVQIKDFDSLMAALDSRLAFFAQMGAKVTDHGPEFVRYASAEPAELDAIFAKAMAEGKLCPCEQDKFQTAFLLGMAKLCTKHKCTMQMHFGVARDVNTRMFEKLGANTGFDIAGDDSAVKDVAVLLNKMNEAGTLPRVILYPINHAQFEAYAIIAAAFCSAAMKAQVSLGVPWWFSDQPLGIKRQFEAVGQVYPLALWAGMVTDSRSFLSYPRHELYRRALCNYIGELLDRQEYVADESDVEALIHAACYGNAKNYFM